ncbi:DNA helicase PIF1/RRM3 [Tanacetum coccineum]
MLDANSAIVKSFQMVRDWCHANATVNVELHLLSERTSSKQYNAPTVAEVAALITNEFGDREPTRDIVVCQKDSPPKRISKLHPSHIALQYPLLFPYGEEGYHEQIPYHTNKGKRKTARDYFTMKEYYAYVIQYRKDQWTTLHRGGRLFQQYLVDAFTAIEEQRLSWTRNNHDTLRVDLYHNVVDEIKGNYQDAMALCRAYGNPDLFITFTSNPKWLEITEMLAYILGQRAHDHLEVGARVFKLKLIELLDNLTNNHVFGATRAVVYVIEFQKQGLPHTHILLWLEEYYRCKVATDIDDIILAELLSPTTDLIGYKAVSDYTLHEPCGKNNRAAACNIEGKCSKHFPKPFCAETIIDQDGYPIYKRRDEKVSVKKNYCLKEIQDLLNRNGRALPEFTDMPQPNTALLTSVDNRLIREARAFDMNKSKIQHQELYPQLNPEQRLIYEEVVDSVHNKKGQFHFVYGPGGTGKTFLYKTIISRLRSELKIVLAVASSGIASLLIGLLIAGSPDDTEIRLRSIRQDTPRYIGLPSPKQTEQNLWWNDGLTWGRFQANSPSNTKGQECRHCTGDALDTQKQMFNQWVLAVGDGKVPARIKDGEDEPTWIEIPKTFLIPSSDSPIQQIVEETYPNFIQRQKDDAYLRERAIFTLK